FLGLLVFLQFLPDAGPAEGRLLHVGALAEALPLRARHRGDLLGHWCPRSSFVRRPGAPGCPSRSRLRVGMPPINGPATDVVPRSRAAHVPAPRPGSLSSDVGATL